MIGVRYPISQPPVIANVMVSAQSGSSCDWIKRRDFHGFITDCPYASVKLLGASVAIWTIEVGSVRP